MLAIPFSKPAKKPGMIFLSLLIHIHIELRFLDSVIMKDYQLPATVECA